MFRSYDNRERFLVKHFDDKKNTIGGYMDTIKLTINGREVTISGKSMIVDNKEYLYTEISAIKHSSANRLYLFNYEGKWQKFYYNEEDTKKASALFKQIAGLVAKRAAHAASEGEPEAGTDGDAAAPEVPAPAEQVSDESGGSGGEAPVEDVKEEPETQTEEVSEDVSEEAPGDISEEAAGEPDKEQDASDGVSVAAVSEASVEELEKKSKLKKAIIIFAIIIILFVGAGVAYFFTIGPSNDASQGPTDGTHQYNDIDELINEIQE